MAFLKMLDQYGGNVRAIDNVYRWEATGQTARNLLKEIIPLLEEKHEQAQLCLDFAHFPPRSLQRVMITKRISALKKTCYVRRDGVGVPV